MDLLLHTAAMECVFVIRPRPKHLLHVTENENTLFKLGCSRKDRPLILHRPSLPLS